MSWETPWSACAGEVMADLSDAAGLEQAEPSTTCGLVLDGMAAQVTPSSVRLCDLQQALARSADGDGLLGCQACICNWSRFSVNHLEVASEDPSRMTNHS